MSLLRKLLTGRANQKTIFEINDFSIDESITFKFPQPLNLNRNWTISGTITPLSGMDSFNGRLFNIDSGEYWISYFSSRSKYALCSKWGANPLDLPSKFAEGHSFKFTVNNSKALEEDGTDTYDVGKYTYFLIEILDINGSVIDSYDSSVLINQYGYGITKDKSRLTNIELRNDCFYNNLAIKYND